MKHPIRIEIEAPYRLTAAEINSVLENVKYAISVSMHKIDYERKEAQAGWGMGISVDFANPVTLSPKCWECKNVRSDRGPLAISCNARGSEVTYVDGKNREQVGWPFDYNIADIATCDGFEKKGE